MVGPKQPGSSKTNGGGAIRPADLRWNSEEHNEGPLADSHQESKWEPHVDGRGGTNSNRPLDPLGPEGVLKSLGDPLNNLIMSSEVEKEDEGIRWEDIRDWKMEEMQGTYDMEADAGGVAILTRGVDVSGSNRPLLELSKGEKRRVPQRSEGNDQSLSTIGYCSLRTEN